MKNRRVSRGKEIIKIRAEIYEKETKQTIAQINNAKSWFCLFLIGLFDFLMLNCMECLYILEINHLPVVSFAIIFSLSEGCLLIWFIVSIAVQKLLSLTKPFCTFSFLFPLFQDVGHRVSCCDYVKECTMFSSKIFIVSGLMFKSLMHFEFIFVYDVRKCSSFILLQLVDQFSQHHSSNSCLENPMDRGAWQATVHGVRYD